MTFYPLALVSADESHTVKVRVSFTDDAGNSESLTSSATATVEPKPNSPATGEPAITGAPPKSVKPSASICRRSPTPTA